MSISSQEMTEPLKRWLGLRGEWGPELSEILQPVLDLAALSFGAVAPYGIPWSFWYDHNAAPGAGLHNFVHIRAVPGYIVRIDRAKNYSNDNLAFLGKDPAALGAFSLIGVPILDSEKWGDQTISMDSDFGARINLLTVGNASTGTFGTHTVTTAELRVGDVWGQGDHPLAWLALRENGTPFFGLRTRAANQAERYHIAGWAFPLL